MSDAFDPVEQTIGDLKLLLARALRDTGRSDRVADEADIVHDVGLDSLQMIQFLLEVETHFRVELDFEKIDLATLGSVRTFAELVGRLKAERG